MKIVLVGGNGFVGESFIKNFSNKEEIIYLSRRENKKEIYSSSNVSYLETDIFNYNNSTIEKIKNFDILIHLIGVINDKNNYEKMNIQSLKQSIELSKEANIKKIVFLSANGGEKNYLDSKKTAEQILKDNFSNYLIVRPGLLYGKGRFSSLFLSIPIKLLSILPISFFKNVYPINVDVVTKNIIEILLTEPNKKLLDLQELKRK